MTRFATNSLAAVLAVLMAATTFTAAVTVPVQPTLAAPALA